MEITHYGGNCVKIAVKGLTVLVDPVTGEYGPDPKLKSDVVLFSQKPQKELASSAEFAIDTPGEFEVKGLTVDGMAVRLHTEESKDVQNGVAYLVSFKDQRVFICGNLHPGLSEEQVERVDGIDALVVPVGGKGLTLDREAASDLVRRFDPRFVVPLHYDDGVVDYPVPQDSVDQFLQEVGASDAAREDSLKVTAKDTSDETTFVVLNPQKK